MITVNVTAEKTSVRIDGDLLARRYLLPPRFLMRPLLNGGTLASARVRVIRAPECARVAMWRSANYRSSMVSRPPIARTTSTTPRWLRRNALRFCST